jgi:hypothetical protein
MLLRPYLVVAVMLRCGLRLSRRGPPPQGRDAMAGPTPPRRSPDSSAAMSSDQPDLGALGPADAVATVPDTSSADLAPPIS